MLVSGSGEEVAHCVLRVQSHLIRTAYSCHLDVEHIHVVPPQTNTPLLDDSLSGYTDPSSLPHYPLARKHLPLYAVYMSLDLQDSGPQEMEDHSTDRDRSSIFGKANNSASIPHRLQANFTPWSPFDTAPDTSPHAFPMVAESQRKSTHTPATYCSGSRQDVCHPVGFKFTTQRSMLVDLAGDYVMWAVYEADNVVVVRSEYVSREIIPHCSHRWVLDC
ncbi:hypothetical protein BDY19DRAFT_1050269 [Irpex rosettiformis]|uniref:Uncharacterized protein n=1 Tax=Irpex rosettiformis TaxID=378272 RepID=A0ACB8TVL8_9APHY|nr:hypothetical protein BDY19DRAFT_1050269 [Irpex rosettiformis]